MLDAAIVVIIVGVTVYKIVLSYIKSYQNKKNGCTGCSSCPITNQCDTAFEKVEVKVEQEVS